MPETWRPIPDFPGYDVSDQGRVRSYWARGGGESLNWHIAEQPQRILKGRTNKQGYSYVILKHQGNSRTVKVHRLVLTVFIGPCPDGLVCCHNDGNSQNNYLNNLRWDTLSANFQDMVKHGTWHPSGPRRYTPEQIVALREARAQGQSIHTLAEQYGCHPQHMKELCLGYHYKDVGGPRVSASDLSYARALKIRQEWLSGSLQKVLASKYHLSSGRISEICNYKAWPNPPSTWELYLATATP